MRSIRLTVALALLVATACAQQSSKPSVSRTLPASHKTAPSAAELKSIGELQRQGKSAEALVGLEALRDKYPDSPSVSLRQYEVYLSVGELDEAAAALNKCIEHTPSGPTKTARLQLKNKLAAEQQVQQAQAAKMKLEIQQKNIPILQMYAIGNKTGAMAEADALVQKYPKSADAAFMMAELKFQDGRLTEAEKLTLKAEKFEFQADEKQRYARLLPQIAESRQAALAKMLDSAEAQIANLDFAGASNAIKDLDSITDYDFTAYTMRAGLLGAYRHYAEAATVYALILKDNSLDASQRAHVVRMQELIDHQIHRAAGAGTRHCPFCGALEPENAAYCPVCLSFQYPVAKVEWKNTVETFNWHDGHLTNVSWQFHQSFGKSNAFSALAGGFLAGASKSTTNVKNKDDIEKTRTFSIEYAGSEPRQVSFKSEANGGQVTTMTAYGGAGSVTTTGHEGGLNSKFSLQDILVYPTSENFDAQFATQAFGVNAVRGFGSNGTFNPFSWNEPHLYVMGYDEQGRVIRCVDVYRYSQEVTAADHLAVVGRKPFTGPNHLDPMTENTYVGVEYNAEGLVSAIDRVVNGKQVYRRTMTYGPNGIASETETSGGQTVNTWTYNWSNGHLATAYLNSTKQTVAFN